jgi:ABC-type polysaccharide/polyol phosphate transport system ATPase subunit
VSKAFVRRHNAARDLKVRFLGLVHPRHREARALVWVLRDVDLRVGPAECLGVIGPNGSGKSTLLRIMARIFPPTRGEVEVRGTIAPVIELGVGFHPELTGLENLHLTMSLYGLPARERQRLVHDIVAFAELERVLGEPLKNYSTGMRARLGFSVAAHLEPDVLLIDEALAVGDESFKEKCMGRMEALRLRGTTLVLVSHDLRTVERMCDRACLLLEGRVAAVGEPCRVIDEYRRAMAASGRAMRSADGSRAPA